MKSLITFEGLPEKQHFQGSLNYIYGLADFWQYWFEDKEILDRYLEATSMQLADIYSRFLQQCSSLSLEDIRSTFHSDIKLFLVNVTPGVDRQVSGSFPYSYVLGEDILSCEFLFDKPLFPTKTYVQDVDYRLEQGVLYTSVPLSQMGFPNRKALVNGKEYDQYSVWASDVEIDSQVLWEYFGRFVRVSPATSTELFKNYIQGLYHLYVHGPSLELLGRGLNLALGIPLARQTEVVLKINADPQTGNYSVITANNNYTIPYRIAPVVNVGDLLEVGREISWVATIQDYQSAGAWWINMAMPRRLFSNLPSNSPTFVSPGSDLDIYMRTFLKNHTFLVKMDIAADFTTESMNEAMRIINDARPTYTCPVFVWSVPVSDEPLLEEDDLLGYSQQCDLLDNMLSGEYIIRDHDLADIAGERSIRTFIHGNGDLTGYLGDTVGVPHKCIVGVNGPAYMYVADSLLIPLYNITLTELRTVLATLLGSTPTSIPDRFVLLNLDLSTHYTGVVVRDAIDPGPGISYNLNNINFWDGEVHRCFIPNHADITSSEHLVFLEVEHGLYSVFLMRNPNTLFSPVYFPPAEEDKLTVTQVPV